MWQAGQNIENCYQTQAFFGELGKGSLGEVLERHPVGAA